MSYRIGEKPSLESHRIVKIASSALALLGIAGIVFFLLMWFYVIDI